MGVSSLMENEMIEMEPSGRVLPIFRGDYLDNVVYENPDIVLYNNSSYVAKTTTIGNPPPTDALSDDNWQMVAKGIIDADVSASIVRFSENESESMENIESGETVKVAFGKLRKALALLFGHYAEKATASILGHVKLSNSAAITKQGEFALDAIEKNATIEGTLAHLIASQNSDFANKLSDMTNTSELSYAYENGFTDADNNWRTSFLKCGKVIMARINCKCSELIPVNSQRNIISLGANMNKDFYICATYGMMVMYASGYLAIIAQQEIPANSWIHGYFVTLLN